MYNNKHACVRNRIQPFVTPCTLACQASLSTGVLQARIPEWVAISSPRGSSLPRDRTASLVFPALAGRFFTPAPPGKPEHMLLH